MSSVFGKNIQNLGGGSVGLGLSPAVANINMANNSIINLNQINGQTFPATAGVSGQIMQINGLGSIYWGSPDGPTGPQGPTGPAQAVGGIQGQITFTWDLCGTQKSVGDPGLTYDWCGQVTNICLANVHNNLSVGKNANITGNITSSGIGPSTIGNVQFSSGNISNATLTTNNIAAWTLTSSNLYSPSMTITTSGSITTPTTVSSSIGGVFMSNTTLSAGNSTIGGLGLSNAVLSASGMTVNGTASFTSATTISGLLTVSAAQVQNALSVSGVSAYGGIATFGSNITVAGTQSNTGIATFGSNITVNGSANVGLTGTPCNYRLNVAGTGGTTAFASFYNSSFGVPYVGIGYDASLDGLSIRTNYGTTDFNRTALFIARSSNIPYVGIQNTNPQYALDVSGVGNFSSNVIIGGSVNILSNLSVSGAFSGTTANLSAITGLSNINGLLTSFDDANQVIFIGRRFSTSNLPAGSLNVFLGQWAGVNYTGSGTVGIGDGAGAFLTGSSNTCIGTGAGNSSTGSSNIFIGTTTGQSSSGSTVIGIGLGAALLNSNSNMIAIGCNAGRGNAFSNTVFLGNTATGYSGPAQANSLTVYSTNTTVPFLFGDLSGRQLGIGTNPSAALDVAGSGIFSGSVTASSGFLQTFSVSGLSILGSLNVSGAVNVSGLLTLSSTTVTGTLSATTLYAPTINTITLSVGGLSTFSNVNITNTVSAINLFSSNSVITTLSATTLSVSGTLTNTTLNICGLATISGASVTNRLTASNIVSTLGTVTTLSVATFSVSAISTLSGVNVTSTLSALNLFSSNGFVNTLSALTANVSGAFNVSGVSTLSNVTVQNTLSSVYIFTPNGLVTTFSAATANVSGAFSVSGLSTLSNVTVTNTLSAFNLFSTNAYITTLSAMTLGVIGNLTVSAVSILQSISGLARLNNVPVVLNDVSQHISFGVSSGIRGLYVNSFGYSAAQGNTGSYVNAIGSNAGVNNSGSYLNAFGFNTGSSNTGSNLTAIGQVAGWSNKGDSVIAIGEGACSTNSASLVIGIGSNAGWSNSGSNVIGIGMNAGQYNTGANSIFIGRNAGSNNQYSNSIILGINPSGYGATAHNTFLVYATSSAAPFLQGDMSGILFGIGKAPTTALDVSGSSVISQTLTVSGVSTLSAARVVNALNVSGLTTLSALTLTSTVISRGVTTICSLVTQGTLSSSNIYVSGGITLATNSPITMNSTFSNQGTTNLADTAITRLNTVTWPTIAGSPGQSLTISSDPGIAFWAPFPIFASLSGWWLVAPNGPVYMNNQQFTSLSGINGVRLNFNSTSNLVGIGANVLTGTTGNGIIAIGLSAGIGSSGSNLIYLGSNPGGTQAYNNRFTVFSTTSGLPFLQGDVSNMQLGIAKSPSTALDVSGSAAISQNLNVSGLATLPNTVATTLSATTLYATTALNTSGTATLNAVNIPTTLGVAGTTTLSTVNTGTLTATSIASTGTITSAGQSTLNSIIVSTTLNVIGNTTLTSMNATSITGITIGSTGTATLNNVTVGGTLGVTGQTTLGNATATSLGATTLTATSALNAGSATATLSATTVNTTLNVCGATNLSSAILSQNLTVCGQTLFKNLSFTTLNGLTWNSPTPATGSTVLSVDSTGRTLTWAALTTIGVQNWAQSVANSTLSMQGYGITGITSFNNVSAVFVSASAQVGLGLGALSNNPASNIVAFGTGAGAVGLNTVGVGPNNIFLGSNPGGSSNVSNSLVVYSQTAGSPLIYGDLARNQVAIAGQSTGGYTLNVNGSAQASRFASPAASSNSIGGVTMSNSILTVGTICNVTNLNGQNLRIDGANHLIGIGANMNLAGNHNIAIGDYAGFSYTQTGIVGGELVAIGTGAGFASIGTSNVLLGYNTGACNTGSFVHAIGHTAGTSNTGSYVNIIGVSAGWSNAASYVDAFGANAGYQNVATGSNLIAIGSNAGFRNYGASNIYIGARAGNGAGAAFNSNSCNAIMIGSLAGVHPNGNANIGNRSINIGTGAHTGQGATDQIAIGTGAQGGNAGTIAIGSGAFAIGQKMIVIGSNASGGTNAADVIAIGTNAGSNLPALSNNIYIGSNAGYRPTTANTLVVQSTLDTVPALQADLANRRLGVGCAPTYSLDVQVTSAGSSGMRIARNDTSNVSAGLFLEAGIMSGFLGATTGNTTLVSFATRAGGGGIALQSLMSIFEGGEYGLSIKAGNTPSSATVLRVTTEGAYRVGVGTVSPTTTLDVSGTFRVTGATTLNVLNGVSWPASTGSANQQLVMNPTGTAAVWAAPGVADAALWSCNDAVRTVNMAGFGLTGLASINGLTTTICSVTNQIGIGANLLTNNTANFVVALGNGAGSNAAANSTWSNCVYLGANPAGGTTAGGANTFLVYSTTAGTPALQVNMGSNWLGVGKVPTVALDVVGAGRVTGNLIAQDRLIVGNFTTNTPCNYAMNIVASGARTGYITWYKNDNQVPYIGMGYDQTNDGIGITSNVNETNLVSTNAFFVSRITGRVGVATSTPAHALDVAGQINTNTAVSTPSLTVTTSTVLTGTLTLPSIASTTYANRVLSYNSTTGAVTQSTLNLQTLGAADSNTMNANWVTTGGGLITWNGSVVSGNNRILAIPVNNAMATDGFFNITEGAWSITMTGWSAAYFVPNSVPSAYPAANGLIKVIPYQTIANQVGSNWIFICSTYADVSPMTLKWGPGFITIPSGGVFNSATGGTSWNVLGQATNIALGSNSSITGAKSIVIGSNAASAVAASNVIAIGTNAGSNLPNLSNNIYIGSNAGYNPTTSNTLVVQSTSATAPALQADLSNRWLGVGMVPSNALDVSGTIRASGPVISTLNISGITSGSSLTLTTDSASTYFSLMTVASNITVTLPPTTPPSGTFWVVKNNSPVNYTLTAANGVFNAGSNSYFLQAGIGTTLAYSGTQANGSPAYYTF